MVLQIIYLNGATVRTGVEIEGSLVVRMLQYGDIVESFQRLKTKEGTVRTYVTIDIDYLFRYKGYYCTPLSSYHSRMSFFVSLSLFLAPSLTSPLFQFYLTTLSPLVSSISRHSPVSNS